MDLSMTVDALHTTVCEMSDDISQIVEFNWRFGVKWGVSLRAN